MRPGRSGAGAAALAAVALLAGCAAGRDAAADPVSTAPGSLISSSADGPSSTTRTPVPPSLPPPYVERAEWAQTEVGPSLQIYPTRAGREVIGDGTADTAWAEVLALAPDGDSPGMRAQFDCHWTFARLVDPEKTSWNLEPDRPVVSAEDMVAARCNPGFAEE